MKFQIEPDEVPKKLSRVFAAVKLPFHNSFTLSLAHYLHLSLLNSLTFFALLNVLCIKMSFCSKIQIYMHQRVRDAGAFVCYFYNLTSKLKDAGGDNDDYGDDEI